MEPVWVDEGTDNGVDPADGEVNFVLVELVAIAVVVALAIHLVAASLIPGRREDASQPQTTAQRVTIARQSPKPRNTPKPLITPKPHYTLAPQFAVRAPAPQAAATPHLHSGGAAAH